MPGSEDEWIDSAGSIFLHCEAVGTLALRRDQPSNAAAKKRKKVPAERASTDTIARMGPICLLVEMNAWPNCCMNARLGFISPLSPVSRACSLSLRLLSSATGGIYPRLGHLLALCLTSAPVFQRQQVALACRLDNLSAIGKVACWGHLRATCVHFSQSARVLRRIQRRNQLALPAVWVRLLFPVPCCCHLRVGLGEGGSRHTPEQHARIGPTAPHPRPDGRRALSVRLCGSRRLTPATRSSKSRPFGSHDRGTSPAWRERNGRKRANESARTHDAAVVYVWNSRL